MFFTARKSISVDETITESMLNEGAIHFMTVIRKGIYEDMQISFMTNTNTYFIRGKHHPSPVEVKQNTQEF
jgi:hypothetical protein